MHWIRMFEMMKITKKKGPVIKFMRVWLFDYWLPASDGRPETKDNIKKCV